MSQNVIESAKSTVKNWWLMALLGTGLILLGLWVFRNPGGTLTGLAKFFAIMLFISSAASVVFAITNRRTLQGWGRNLAAGVLELLVAIILLRNPDAAGLALNFLLGFWVMFRGSHLISMAFEMRNYHIRNWNLVMIGGLLALLLAFCILFDPLTGAVTISIWAGTSLVIAGIANIFVALALRKVKLKVSEIKDFITSE